MLAQLSAIVAPGLSPDLLREMPHPRMAYPSLRLAVRALPRTMAAGSMAPADAPTATVMASPMAATVLSL